MKHHRLLLCITALAFTATAHAKFRGPEIVPVDRLVKKAEAYLETHKDDADAYYTLGRIHYLAFHLRQEQIPAYGDGGEGGKPQPAESWAVQMAPPATPVPAQQDLIAHAAAALKNFEAALKLAPKNGLYLLGYASLLEDFHQWSATLNQNENPTFPPGLKRSIKDIRAAYALALSCSMELDTKIQRQPIHGIETITSYEAAEGIVRLSEIPKDPLSAEEQKSLTDAQAAIAKFKGLPRGPVTPIVFSFHPAAHLAELLDPVRIVDFDLRGYGPRDQWSWVRPDLGILVWDSAQRGDITSASQLFGSYTFQLFWKNGYAALAALDDNSDGQLTGDEMRGISVWFDRNGDGRSTPGEVTPVEKLGITSIAVTAESQDGIHPTNPRGITLRDGTTLRTWDWITTPATPQTTAMK